MSEEMPPKVSELLQRINDDPALLSLLYDADLLPEQLKRDSKEWFQMLCIAAHWQHRATPPQSLPPELVERVIWELQKTVDYMTNEFGSSYNCQDQVDVLAAVEAHRKGGKV